MAKNDYFLPNLELNDEASQLANLLRGIKLSGNVMDLPKNQGKLVMGNLGYQSTPNELGNSWNVGATGMGAVNNPYISPKLTGFSAGYSTPDQRIALGYYPMQGQFQGQPIGPRGFSLEYMKAFD
jgi:hypothetical protein